MGYQKIDEINGNYRVVRSSIAGDLNLINTIEAEGWKLLFTDSNSTNTYYYFTKRPIILTLTARDRGRVEEIIKALEFLEEDKLISYYDEINFLKGLIYDK